MKTRTQDLPPAVTAASLVKPDNRTRARELRALGWTYAAIGAELHVTHQCARQYCLDSVSKIDLCQKCGNPSRVLYVKVTKGKEERLCPGCFKPKEVA